MFVKVARLLVLNRVGNTRVLMVYGFFVPLSYLCLLVSQRKALLKGIKTEMTEALDFLHREYQNHFFWWEIVDTARKLILMGVLGCATLASMH